MAEQVYVKGIVMQQLRKVAWANGDSVAAGQIAIKLSSDSLKVEEVRVGTNGGTWGTATPVPTKDYVDAVKSYADTTFATKGALSDHAENHTDLSFTVATYKNNEVSDKDYTYDAISGNTPVEEILADTLYVDNKITAATTPLSTRITTIEDLKISENYATKKYTDDAEADAIEAANKYADDNFVKTTNLATAVQPTISEALTHTNTLSIKVDGAAPQVYDPDPAVSSGLKELDLVSRETHIADLNGKENTGVAASLVNAHNISTTAHTDIRDKIAALEEAIGATSNIMNFRGVYASLDAANAALTTKEYGDVIVITNGKEYVWAKDTAATPEQGKWYELGDTSGNAAAISTLQSSLGALSSKVDQQLMAEVWPIDQDGNPDTAGSSRIDTNASNISTLQTAVTTLNGAEGATGSVKATAKSYADAAKSAVVGASGDAASANTIYGAKKYADGQAAAVLGASGDAATANTVYGAKAAAAAAQNTANTATTAANDVKETVGYAVKEIWGDTPAGWNEPSRIDNLESTRLTAVKAGTGISVSNATALQPEVSLAEVSGLTASTDYEFCVFKVDQYGRIIAKAQINVLDGNA